MTQSWNIKETRELVKALYGDEQLALANPSLRSVLERRDYANLHWHDIRVALRRFERQAAKTPLFALAFSADEKISSKYWIDQARVQANATALVQSLHAIPDIYAHALYYSVNLNNGPGAFKEDRYINASRVRDKLSASDEGKLRELFSQLFEGDSARHVAAISNQSKHRSVVQPNLNENYTVPKDRVSLIFPAFSYEGKKYESASVRDLTESVYNNAAQLIVEIGNELSVLLRNRLAARIR